MRFLPDRLLDCKLESVCPFVNKVSLAVIVLRTDEKKVYVVEMPSE